MNIFFLREDFILVDPLKILSCNLSIVSDNVKLIFKRFL